MKRKSLAQSIIDNISPEPMTGCWLWTGHVDKDGYGKITNRKARQQKAHRISFEQFVGAIPQGLQIDHLCRVRCCVNPKHLEPVTPKVNTNRGRRANSEKTACKLGHPFDIDNTRLVGNARQCKACDALRQRKYRALRKER